MVTKMNRFQIQTRFTDHLAISGRKPAFEKSLHVGRPNIGNRQQFMAYATQIFENRWLTNYGPFVQQFEAELARFLGVEHCLTVNNATTGLEIAIRALGLSGEVIVPSFTFIASAHALYWLGITPIFCDVDPRTHTIDPDHVEKLITPRTTGIMGVHLWGHPCQVDVLQDIADRHHLKLLYDAAHAFGCSANEKMIGNFGDAEVFSFHATKFFNTFEGGAITTNDDDLAERIRRMRNFGFVQYDEVAEAGINGKMSEISAAMGLVNLKSLDEFVSVNQRNYHQYREEFTKIPGVRLAPYDEYQKCNFQYIPVEVDSQITGVHRDTLIELLHAENVLARRYFWPGCHRMEPYISLFPDASLSLPVTEKVGDQILVLPTGTAVGEREIEIICDIIQTAVTQAASHKRKPARFWVASS